MTIINMAVTYRHLLSFPCSTIRQHPSKPAPPLRPVPPPMLPNNSEASANHCLLSSKLQGVVTAAQGFQWVNEAQPDAVRPKWGYVASKPGSRLELTLSTQAGAGAGSGHVMLDVAHLKSYEGMGRALVRWEARWGLGLCSAGVAAGAAVPSGEGVAALLMACCLVAGLMHANALWLG